MNRSNPVRDKVKRYLSRLSYASVCNDRRWLKIIQLLHGWAIQVKHYDLDVMSEPGPIWSPARYYAETSYGPFYVLEIEWLESPWNDDLLHALLEQKAAISREGAAMRIWGHVKPGTAPSFIACDRLAATRK